MARGRLTSESTPTGVVAAVRAPRGRAQVSFGLMWTSESAFVVGLAVVAFRGGGVAAVGVVTAMRMAVAAVLAPVLATTADRVRREVVLTAVGLVRAVSFAGTAVVTAVSGPSAATYGCAAVATVALALYRPAHSALLPALVRSPRDLTSANAMRGTLDSLSALGGPVAASALLATTGATAVFALCAALSLLSGLVVLRLPYDAPPRARAERSPAIRSVLQGFATIAGDRDIALITALGVVQTFTRGCLTVLAVVLALDLLDTGEPGVGILSAAVGAGGIAGSLCALALVGRGGLATWFGVGVALFGAPLAVVGVFPQEAAALVLFGLIGVGNSLIDVAAFTILARRTDEAVLARTFAGFEALLTLGVALGGLLAPVAVEALGPRGALVVVGLLAPLAVVLRRPALRRLDGELRLRDADIRVLREVPMLAALPVTTVEQLVSGMQHVEYAPGQAVFEQGDPGDEYFVVTSGSAEVSRGGTPVNALSRGAGFGDIALLGDVRRTATVRASGAEPLCLAVIRRAPFLTAVTGYPASAAAGYDSVEAVRARDRARLPGDEVV